jgi:extradiol dioxygenase family protein
VSLRPFHLAAPIDDKETTRAFYTDRLGCTVGREAEHWIDFDFFGHQLSFHIAEEDRTSLARNEVDGKSVPVRHFGVVLAWGDWISLRDRLESTGQDFVIAPYIRFAGQPGEQATMFFYDPSGNALEFKAFKNDENLFAS